MAAEDFYRTAKLYRRPYGEMRSDAAGTYQDLIDSSGRLSRDMIMQAGKSRAAGIENLGRVYSQMPKDLVNSFMDAYKWRKEMSKLDQDYLRAEEALAFEKQKRPLDLQKLEAETARQYADVGMTDAQREKILQETAAAKAAEAFKDPRREADWLFNRDMEKAKADALRAGAAVDRAKAAGLAEETDWLKQPVSVPQTGNVVPYAPGKAPPKVMTNRELKAKTKADEAAIKQKKNEAQLAESLKTPQQKMEDEAKQQALNNASKALTEAETHHAAIKLKTKQLHDLVKEHGTTGRAENFFTPGSAPEDMDRLIYEIAIEKSKLVDPSTAAREGEVESQRKYAMPIRNQFGLGMTNQTALDIIEKNSREADDILNARRNAVNQLIGKPTIKMDTDIDRKPKGPLTAPARKPLDKMTREEKLKEREELLKRRGL